MRNEWRLPSFKATVRRRDAWPYRRKSRLAVLGMISARRPSALRLPSVSQASFNRLAAEPPESPTRNRLRATDGTQSLTPGQIEAVSRATDRSPNPAYASGLDSGGQHSPTGLRACQGSNRPDYPQTSAMLRRRWGMGWVRTAEGPVNPHPSPPQLSLDANRQHICNPAAWTSVAEGRTPRRH
jgi:hypothetical protein